MSKTKRRGRLKPRDPSNELLRELGHSVLVPRGKKRQKDKIRKEIEDALDDTSHPDGG